MPNRPRYRLHAMLELARCFGTEPVPTGTLTDREDLTRNHFPAPLTLFARVPSAPRVWATDLQIAYTRHPAAAGWLPHEPHALRAPLIPGMLAEHAYSITGIDVHSARQESNDRRECIARDQNMTQTGLED